MGHKEMLKLMFELGILVRTPRTGPYHVGITSQETIAAHAFRTMALAYFIAQEERAETGKVLKMCLIHDLPEARLLDQTFIQERWYAAKDRAENVFSEQLRGISGSQELQELFRELMEGKTKEAQVVKDADILESLIEAREYIQQGIKIMEHWFSGKRERLLTQTGKRLFDLLQKETILWWK